MKTLYFSAAVVLTSFLFAFNSIDPLPIGGKLPQSSVAVKDISGKTITLADAVGKSGLLVMFSCNTCPYVIKNQERTAEVCAYAKKNNLGVIVLNSNEANRSSSESFTAMQQYAKNQKYNWYYAVDENNVIADAFGANRTPECFLFNPKQELVYHGAIDDNPSDAGNVTRHHLQSAIDELLAGKEVSVKESRSVGCGIKRKS